MKDIDVLEECAGCCTMCKHARYYEWAVDDNDFYCELDEITTCSEENGLPLKGCVNNHADKYRK